MEVLDKDGLDYFWDKVKSYIDSNLISKENLNVPVGTILIFTGSYIQNNNDTWRLCDGSGLSSLEYPELYNVIGNTYGASSGNTDGEVIFNLPDLQGRIPIGRNTSDSDFAQLGNTGGSKTHIMTIDELVPHRHRVGTAYQTGGGSGTDYINPTSNTQNTTMTGGGQPMDIMNPYITIHYIIKIKPTEV